MMERCYNPKARSYPRYGGRGIAVCAEWHDVGAFIEWALANGCAPHLTIEREDNDDNYCPSNCGFIPHIQQAKNRRTTRLIAAFGKSMDAVDWAKDTGIPLAAIKARLSRGWSHERAVSVPSGSTTAAFVEVNSEKRRIGEIEKSLGLSQGALRHRLKKMSVAEACSMLKRDNGAPDRNE